MIGKGIAISKNFKEISVGKTPTRSSAQFIWEQFSLPRIKALKQADLIHIPNMNLSSFKMPIKTIATVHDLNPDKLPNIYLNRVIDRFKYQTRKRAARKNLAHIITGSQNSKEDIQNILKTPEDKITVIPLAVNKSTFRPLDSTELDEARKKLGIQSNFILYTGNTLKHKNVDKLLKAFAQAKKKLQEKYTLVITGKPNLQGDRFSTNIEQLIRKLKLQDDIVFPEFSSDEDLNSFYNLCNLFVFPSSYEGFGLPVLEAMTAGAPVLTTSMGSLKEVISDSTPTVDPNNINQFSEKLIELLSNSEKRKSVADYDLNHAKKFSWLITAEKTLEVYKEVFPK